MTLAFTMPINLKLHIPDQSLFLYFAPRDPKGRSAQEERNINTADSSENREQVNRGRHGLDVASWPQRRAKGVNNPFTPRTF